MDEYLKKIETLEKRVDTLQKVISVQLKINQKVLEQLSSLTGATETLSEASINHSKIFKNMND